MKPPKRSPFLHSRQADLLEVYRHLYPDSQGRISATDRHRALSTVQLWINRSACPFAVETTALLVQSVVLDEFMQKIAADFASNHVASTSTPHYALEQMGGGAELGVRLNYSLALTRFVNSVVDSHQTGGFAQSIAAIAARIGLPLWFVEIRHATTHEELPSISVCRQAAGSALAWLHRHFWIPQLFEGPNALPIRPGSNGHDADAMDVDPTAEASTSALGGPSTSKSTLTQEEEEQDKARRKERRKALHDLRLTIKNYRDLAKKVSRDRSLLNPSKNEFHRLYRQFAGFVSRIRTLEPDFGASLIDIAKTGKDEEVDARGAAVMDPDDVDECTKSALSDLINQLIQPGGLVPMGRSKRVPDTAGEDEIVLPAELARVWSPLLGHLRDTFGPIFGQLLAEELVEAVVSESDSNEDAETAQQVVSADASADQDDPSSQAWKQAAYLSPSYRKTADAWIRYLVTTAPPTSSMPGTTPTHRPATTLITDAEVAEMCLPFKTSSSASVLEFLLARNAELKAKIGMLVEVIKVTSFVASAAAAMEVDSPGNDVETARGNEEVSGFETQLEAMQRRLRDVEALSRPGLGVSGADEEQGEPNLPSDRAGEADVSAAASGDADQPPMPMGWSTAGADWKPTPFGCLDGRIPNLVV